MTTESDKFNFGLIPEYLTQCYLYPEDVKLCYLCFLDYEKYNEYIPKKLEDNYKNLDPKYLAKLPFDYKEKVKKVKEGMKTNQEFFTKVANLYVKDFGYVKLSNEQISNFEEQEESYISKYFLEMLIREWGEEGKEERSKTISPVIQELKKYYDYENKDLMGKGVNVLIIGSKFMRVAYEVAKLGYITESNERSFFYILIANYLFNHSKKNENCICPRISSFCSSFTEESVTKKHYFPDVDIQEDLKNIEGKNLIINNRKFEEEYLYEKELYNCVITSFSTDEATNIIHFTEIIYNILVKGGIWINLGGINGNHEEYGGFDLTWDEWKHVILKCGFEFKREETPMMPFCQIKGHSLPFTIGTVFFTVQKK